jgi:hypothetical protein
MRKVSLLLFALSIMALCVRITSVLAAEEPYIIPAANITIDGKPDADLEDKTAKFDMSLICIAGSITEPAYYAYLCYDAENIYFACQAEDDSVNCPDDVTRDFKDSDYVRFYICVGEDFKGRQALNGKTDWAIVFAPQNPDEEWKPMVRECPYNGPGHGLIEGDDITPNRASGPVEEGWYVEAAIPFSLFGITRDDLEGRTFGVYFIGGDTDGSGVRSGEVRMPAVGAGDYWESPDFWQPAQLGVFAVEPAGKKTTTWGNIKRIAN